MPEPSVKESVEKPDSLLWLQRAIEKRISNASKEEQREIDTLIQRALEPQCDFDRKYARLLYALALVPDQVSWYLKFRERVHRLIHQH
jgi:hypothetical protein